jgi:hypothetical protein
VKDIILFVLEQNQICFVNLIHFVKNKWTEKGDESNNPVENAQKYINAFDKVR